MAKISIYSTFDLRRHAVEAIQRGTPRHEIADTYDADRTTLYRWQERFAHEGINGLQRRPGSGRPRKMSDITGSLLKDIVLKSPLAFGFESDLWDVKHLHQVVMKNHRGDISRETIRRRLVEAGLTCQKPEREYYEADENVRKHWRRYTIPVIRRCVLKHHAILYFQDESNVSLSGPSRRTPLGKTWSPCGVTPKAILTFHCCSVSMIPTVACFMKWNVSSEIGRSGN